MTPEREAELRREDNMRLCVQIDGLNAEIASLREELEKAVHCDVCYGIVNVSFVCATCRRDEVDNATEQTNGSLRQGVETLRMAAANAQELIEYQTNHEEHSTDCDVDFDSKEKDDPDCEDLVDCNCQVKVTHDLAAALRETEGLVKP